MTDQPCDHKFVHLETARFTKYADYNTRFTKIDRFFCEKCLEFPVGEMVFTSAKSLIEGEMNEVST